jgi:hypothetical protein
MNRKTNPATIIVTRADLSSNLIEDDSKAPCAEFTSSIIGID